MKKALTNIVHLMYEKYQLDISMFSMHFLENTILTRMHTTNNSLAVQYFNLLNENSNEAFLLYRSFTNSFSTFFRNPLAFSILNQLILPKILADKARKNDPEIRIWSVGCAAGQEPYSLAMTLEDLLVKTTLSVNYRIFATDTASRELEIANEGIYDFDTVKSASYDYIRKFFLKTGNFYKVTNRIKDKVEFSDYDLLDVASSSPPASIFGDFDLIMCCNVLFYYKPEIQKSILKKFVRSICQGGFLLTGETESGIVNSAKSFRSYAPQLPFFVKP